MYESFVYLVEYPRPRWVNLTGLDRIFDSNYPQNLAVWKNTLEKAVRRLTFEGVEMSANTNAFVPEAHYIFR